MTRKLLAGFARTEMRPGLQLHLDGYEARAGVAVGHLDPLMIRAFVLRQASSVVCVVTLDVLGVSEDLVSCIRRALFADFGARTENVMITATHTHSGPTGFARYPDVPPLEATYAREVVMSIVGVVRTAHDSLRPALLQETVVAVRDVAANRRDAEEPVDTTLHSSVFTDAHGGALLGIFGNFACHPTVLGHENNLYSGDLFGAATRGAEAVLGCTCILSNGASADVSTRFTRRDQGKEEVQRLGGIVASSWVRSIECLGTRMSDGSTPLIRSAHTKVVVKLSPPQHPAKAAAVLKELRAEYDVARRLEEPTGILRSLWTRVEGAEALLQRSLAPSPSRTCSVSVTALVVGRVVYLFLPGEVFQASYRGWSKAAFRSATVRLVSLSNGYLGYFPTREAVEANAYEALISPFNHEAGISIGAASDMLIASLA